MAKLTVSVVATTVVGLFFTVALASSRAAGPPDGLTSYGRVVWNLDAVLRDTFGERHVYLSIPQAYPRVPRNFSTVQGADCCSAYYLPTFRVARHSAFLLLRPAKPPKPEVGAAGAEVPLTIKRSYIDCGGGKWLFEHYGNGPANWQISCHR